MAVKVIPAKKRAHQAAGTSDRPVKLRVAAYCRVSTDMEEQESSYEAQVRHYTEYILRNPDWILAGIFADEGISGTATRGRDEFNRMIAGCMNGDIDMVITKSISRFARNTLDCLKYIRQLKERGIPIYFEKENINTLDAKGEVLITIMASLAQQESQSISQNVRMGIQYQYQQGKVRINHTWFLGYTKDEEGRLVIVPEEAEVVKRIYREFLEGRSIRKIAQGLEADGIKTGAGRTKWYESTIRSILKNEKYMGDALIQKEYTVDFLTKKKARNYGELPQYYVENDHEPIISREIFQQVQGEFLRRASRVSGSGMNEGYSSNYALTGKMICGKCGSSYRRMKAHGTNIHTMWRCKKRLQKGAPCKGRNVREEDVQAAVLTALSMLAEGKDALERRKVRIGKKLLPQCHRDLEILDARMDEIRRKVLAEPRQAPVQGRTTDGGTASYSSSRISHPMDRDEMAAILELNKEMGQIRVQKNDLRETMSALTQEELQLQMVLDYLEAHSTLTYDEASMLSILDRVVVTENGFKINFIVGKTYRV